MKIKAITLTTLALLGTCGTTFAADSKFEGGSLKPFLGEPKLDIQQVFKGDRFPNVVTAVDGTVVAVWGGVQARRSEDGGVIWSPEIPVAKGHMGGGVTVNEANGDIFAFVGEHHPPTKETVYRSQDNGKSWALVDALIQPDSKGNKPEMHMNEHGITLRHGTHKGRLIRPTRYYGIRDPQGSLISSVIWVIQPASASPTSRMRGWRGIEGLDSGDNGRRPIPFALRGVSANANQCQSTGNINAGLRRFFNCREYDQGYREDPTDQRQLVLLLWRTDDGFEMRSPHQTTSDPGAGGEPVCGTDQHVHP